MEGSLNASVLEAEATGIDFFEASPNLWLLSCLEILTSCLDGSFDGLNATGLDCLGLDNVKLSISFLAFNPKVLTALNFGLSDFRPRKRLCWDLSGSKLILLEDDDGFIDSGNFLLFDSRWLVNLPALLVEWNGDGLDTSRLLALVEAFLVVMSGKPLMRDGNTEWRVLLFAGKAAKVSDSRSCCANESEESLKENELSSKGSSEEESRLLPSIEWFRISEISGEKLTSSSKLLIKTLKSLASLPVKPSEVIGLFPTKVSVEADEIKKSSGKLKDSSFILPLEILPGLSSARSK